MATKMLYLLIWCLALPAWAGFLLSGEDTSPSSLIMRQPLSHHDLDNKTWAQSSMVLQAKNGVRHTLHNYTVDDDTQIGRWTSHEQIQPHQRRAYSFSPGEFNRHAWSNQLRRVHTFSNTEAVRITLCFNNDTALLDLEQVVKDAICRWDNALALSRVLAGADINSVGVKFVWQTTAKGPMRCYSPADAARRINGERYIVKIYSETNDFGRSTIGKDPVATVRMGRGNTNYPTEDGFSKTDRMTQLLGELCPIPARSSRSFDMNGS